MKQENTKYRIYKKYKLYTIVSAHFRSLLVGVDCDGNVDDRLCGKYGVPSTDRSSSSSSLATRQHGTAHCFTSGAPVKRSVHVLLDAGRTTDRPQLVRQ